MKQMIHVISRELIERKLIFAGALMIGMMVLASPLLPIKHGGRAIETITEAAVILSLGWAAATAAASGASVFGRELAERRMGFYFGKPISGWSIWGGKMVGAFLLTVLSGLLVIVPATMFGGGLFMLAKAGSGWDLGEFAWGFTAALIIAMSIGHVASIALRSRSKWVALDVFGIMIVAFILWGALQPIAAVRAKELFWTLLGVLLFVAGIAFIVAGAVGVLLGRVDIRLVHRATSITLIGILGVTALAFAGYSLWVRSAEPDDLTHFDLKAISSSGNWFAFDGRSKGRGDYVSAFVMNRQNGEWFRIPPQRHMGILDFSKDGRSMVWGEFTNPTSNLAAIHFADLGSGKGVSKGMHVSLNPTLRFSSGPVLSPDGSRMALINDGVLSVYATSTRQSLATLKMPAARGVNYFVFVTNDLLRIHLTHEFKNEIGESDWKTTMYEFIVSSKTLNRLGEADIRFGIVNAEGDRVIGYRRERERVIVDGRTGQFISTIGRNLRARWLSDGRIALIREDEGRVQLEILTRDGESTRTIDVAHAPKAFLGSEVARGKILVGTSLKPGSGHEIATSIVYLVDVNDGTAKKVGDKMIEEGWYIPNLTLLARGPLFVNEKHDLISFNPLTGERKTLIETKE